ncbi:uncharacterized protein LOC144652103 [Oculina patagonica]
MSVQQFKEITLLKDTTYFPIHCTKDDIDAQVMDALIKANAYEKPPGHYRVNSFNGEESLYEKPEGHYRYYITTRTICGYKYRNNRTIPLYTRWFLVPCKMSHHWGRYGG